MNFIITIKDSARSRMEEITIQLQKMGVHVERVLKITGIITGSGTSEIDKLEQIEGVKKVERSKQVFAKAAG